MRRWLDYIGRIAVTIGLVVALPSSLPMFDMSQLCHDWAVEERPAEERPCEERVECEESEAVSEDRHERRVRRRDHGVYGVMAVSDEHVHRSWVSACGLTDRTERSYLNGVGAYLLT